MEAGKALIPFDFISVYDGIRRKDKGYALDGVSSEEVFSKELCKDALNSLYEDLRKEAMSITNNAHLYSWAKGITLEYVSNAIWAKIKKIDINNDGIFTRDEVLTK